MKQRTTEGFGSRLAAIRKGRGLTQAALADAVGVSSRVILYYEKDDAQPPGAMLADLARALEVTTDELLGLKPIKERMDRKTARLRRRIERIELLPPADQRAVLKVLEAMLESRGLAST